MFLWIRPRELKRSRIGWATSKAALAPAASLASSALSTFLTAGLDICHGGYPRKSVCETLVGEMRKNEREIMGYSNTCVKSGVCLP